MDPEKLSLLLSGIRLMVLGMGMVFLFLALMIISMNIMEKVLRPFAHIFQAPAKPALRASVKSSDEDIALVAVAAAAVAVEMARNQK